MQKGWFSHIDLSLVIPVLILIFFSLIILFSISTTFFINQFIFFLICIGVFLFFSQINLTSFDSLVVPLYVISLVLLGIVLGIGFESRGAVRWIDIFGFRIQFSEILKPVLIFCLAVFLGKRNDVSIKTFGLVVLLLLPVLFLIYKQPDLGNALIYGFVVCGTLMVYGFPWWWFLAGIGGVGVLIPFSLKFLHEYQKQRLLTFFHLSNDPLGTSYNAIQAIIAVGSGMFLGKGLGLGTQSLLKFLPERHTDFIFATLSEEMGFLGSSIVILTFAFLFYRLWLVFSMTEDRTERIFVSGAFLLILIQFFVNAGMNMGLLPIVGVTLPFMSYGGSSFLSNAILLGVVSGIAGRSHRKGGLEIM